MNNRMTWIVGAVAAIAVMAIGTVVLTGNNDDGPRIVRVGSFSVAIDYAPYLIARERGTLADALAAEGYGVDYVTFQSLPPINEALATSNVDVVFEAAPPAIVGASADVPVRIVGIGASLQQEILVSSNTDITDPVGLRGRRIGVLAGTSSHYGLLNTLQEAGVADGDVEIFDLVPPDAQAAFDSGQIDAWAVWPPFVEQAIINGTGRVLTGGDAQIHSVVAMRSGFLDDDPAAARAVLNAIEETQVWMVANPEEAQGIVASVLDLDLEVVALAWPKHDWSSEINAAFVADVQSKADFLYDQGLIRSRLNVESQLITPVE